MLTTTTRTYDPKMLILLSRKDCFVERMPDKLKQIAQMTPLSDILIGARERDAMGIMQGTCRLFLDTGSELIGVHLSSEWVKKNGIARGYERYLLDGEVARDSAFTCYEWLRSKLIALPDLRYMHDQKGFAMATKQLLLEGVLEIALLIFPDITDQEARKIGSGHATAKDVHNLDVHKIFRLESHETATLEALRVVLAART